MGELDHQSLPILIFNVVSGIVAWIAAYTGSPIEPAVILATLMIFDFFAGVSAAYKRGDAITSQKMKLGVIGKFLILLIPLTVALISKGTDVELGQVVTWLVYVLIVSEGYSVISNTVCFHTGRRLPELDAMALIGNKLKDILNVILFPKP